MREPIHGNGVILPDKPWAEGCRDRCLQPTLQRGAELIVVGIAMIALFVAGVEYGADRSLRPAPLAVGLLGSIASLTTPALARIIHRPAAKPVELGQKIVYSEAQLLERWPIPRDNRANRRFDSLDLQG